MITIPVNTGNPYKVHIGSNIIKTVGNEMTKLGISGKALVVTETVDEKVVKSARNIAGVATTIATILSPYMILTNGVMVVDKSALAKIEEVFA
jgi:large subunit ribosomal protein L4